MASTKIFPGPLGPVEHPISENPGYTLGNGSPALCTSSFGTLPHLDPEGIQPKANGIAEICTPFYLLITMGVVI